MKPVSWDKQLGLASPLETAASQSGKIKSPSNKEAGLDVSHHALVSREGRGENFFLDILFYRMSVIAMLRQQSLRTIANSTVFIDLPFHSIPPTISPPHDRPDHFPLPDRREARRRRDGRGLQSRRHAPASLRSPQVPAGRSCPRPTDARPLSTRSSGGV